MILINYLFIFQGLQDFYITHNGKIIQDIDEQFGPNDFVQVNPRLSGGKGGFGSMLRALGSQIEKTNNKAGGRKNSTSNFYPTWAHSSFQTPFRYIKRGKEVDDETQWNFFSTNSFWPSHHFWVGVGEEPCSLLSIVALYVLVRSLPHKEQRGSRHLIIIFRCVTDFLPERKKGVHGQFLFSFEAYRGFCP